jgi:hypothetical protein
MHEGIGSLTIKHERRVTDGQHVCEIARTTEQLQQIAQAIDEGDEAFLATVEGAILRALDEALIPQTNKGFRRF